MVQLVKSFISVSGSGHGMDNMLGVCQNMTMVYIWTQLHVSEDRLSSNFAWNLLDSQSSFTCD